MRVAVLPRDVSARVITSSVARAAGALNAVSLTLALPMLVEYMSTRGLIQRPPLPFLILIVLTALAVFAALRPRPFVAVTFLVVGAIGAVAFEVILLTVHPQILDEALYLLNRPAVALVLVGVAAKTVRAGLAWTIGGFLLSNVVTLAVTLIVGVPFTPGYGPLFTLLLMVAVYGALAAIQLSLRRRVPDFDVLENETRRMALEENMHVRVTAAVHDTLLNDLSLVMNAPEELDTRMTDRLREDIRTLTSADWLSESAEVVLDDQDSLLRNRVMLLVSEMQWRGLTVHVTGTGPGIYRLDDTVAVVAVDVIRVCLENVLRHSGATIAELDLVYTGEGVTVMVTDQGTGFDPSAIAPDRLGLRNSVTARVRSVGGDVKIWSTPGEGTSIVVTLPVAEVVTKHEESTHGGA
jgi:signal transduction histidine kinase